MPHIHVVGPCRARDLAEPLSGFSEQRPPWIAKVEETFLSADGHRLLLDLLLVEQYLRQSFFLLVRDEEDGVLLRCHPSSAVQKTDGVKLLIALLGRRCLSVCPAGRIGNTNLQSWLARLDRA